MYRANFGVARIGSAFLVLVLISGVAFAAVKLTNVPTTTHSQVIHPLVSQQAKTSSSPLSSMVAGAMASTTTSGCILKPVTFGFFNGVGNTKFDALLSLGYIRKEFGEYTENGREIQYKLFYNQTETTYEDILETFKQRIDELDPVFQNRYEYFFESGYAQNSFSSSIGVTYPELLNTLQEIENKRSESYASQLQRLLIRNLNLQDYLNHKIQIDNDINSGNYFLFFAHSQGNLYANSAYQYTVGKKNADTVKAVHVAPASTSTNGEHTLADKDLVINKYLRDASPGSVPPKTTDIPAFFDRPPGLNGETNFLGHGLLEIYLNRYLDTSSRIKGHVAKAFRGLPELVSCRGELLTKSYSFNVRDTGTVEGQPYTYRGVQAIEIPRFYIPETELVDIKYSYTANGNSSRTGQFLIQIAGRGNQRDDSGWPGVYYDGDGTFAAEGVAAIVPPTFSLEGPLYLSSHYPNDSVLVGTAEGQTYPGMLVIGLNLSTAQPYDDISAHASAVVTITYEYRLK